MRRPHIYITETILCVERPKRARDGANERERETNSERCDDVCCGANTTHWQQRTLTSHDIYTRGEQASDRTRHKEQRQRETHTNGRAV